MSPILSARNLTKVFGNKKPVTVVNGISLDLFPGEILGFLGPNGSGKTTTIQMLLGTLSYTSGSIHYFGKDFSLFRSEVLQHVTFASTYTSLPHILTVEENLHCCGMLYGLSHKETKKRADPLLERFGILDKKKSRVSSLSAGQVTRLMIVKAFFIEPRIVLLDEPTASLDPDVAREVCDFLLEQRKKTGLSILFTSHRMEEAAELCDRVIFLKGGKIIANDLPSNLAKSVSSFRVALTIVDGMKRTLAIATKQNLSFQVEGRRVLLSLDEKSIPPLLGALTGAEISYTNIQIEEPSLEDYFLHIAEDTQ